MGEKRRSQTKTDSRISIIYNFHPKEKVLLSNYHPRQGIGSASSRDVDNVNLRMTRFMDDLHFSKSHDYSKGH